MLDYSKWNLKNGTVLVPPDGLETTSYTNQSITTFMPGKTYTLSFESRNHVATGKCEVAVLFRTVNSSDTFRTFKLDVSGTNWQQNKIEFRAPNYTGVALVRISIQGCLKAYFRNIVLEETAAIVDTEDQVWNANSYPPPGYKLVFNDEFRNNKLNDQKWHKRFIYSSGTLDHLDGEAQRYRDENVVVKDHANGGLLCLTAKKDANGNITSGMIRSDQTFKYGYFETRVKMPKGVGVFPAFWINTDVTEDGKLTWPPEIDFFEFVNNGVEEKPNMIHSAVVNHTGDGEKTLLTASDKTWNEEWRYWRAPFDFTDAFHTIGVEWTPTYVRFFVDNKLISERKQLWQRKTDSGEWVEGPPGHIILNFAVGGPWAGKYGINMPFPAEFQVSYVRVYQKPPVGVPPLDPDEPAGEYNHLYPANWQPDTLKDTRISLPIDMLDKGVLFADPEFETMMRRASAKTDSKDNVGYMRQDYSRRSPYNADSTKYVLTAENGWWYLYDKKTNTVIDGGRTGTPGMGAINGPAGDCEWQWHPTDPNKAWHTGLNGSLIWYEHDITTHQSTVMFDLTTLVKGKGGKWANAARANTRGEGSCSRDGRFWTFLIRDVNFNIIGFIRYDKGTNSILGSQLLTETPDHCSTSPLTGRSVLSFYSESGVRLYNADYTSYKLLSTLGQHSDLGVDHLDREVFVWITFHGDKENLVDGTVSWCLLEDPSQRWSTGIGVFPAQAGVGDGVHISMCAWDKPGYVVVSIYSGVGKNPYNGRVLVTALIPGAEVFRLCDHRSNTGLYNPQTEDGLRYSSEPQAVPDRKLESIMFASNLGKKENGIMAYELLLPSWVFPKLN